MAEIEALEWNGYNVISTFSGGGGSCLGYRMAGYRVLWANEFIPAAQDTYKANHPNSILDTRDIRTVQPQDILDAVGLKRGELDIFDGSPPCASFSTAGKREKGWGEVKSYSDTSQRVDDLFFEYTRLLEGLQPKVFIAENVSGLVKGTAKGYFKEILKALRDCGYIVEARLLNARWLGVPQKRERVIFMGVRNDLNIHPAYPLPLKYQYTLIDAFGNSLSVPPIEPEADISRFAVGKEWLKTKEGDKSSKYINLIRCHRLEPANTITTPSGGSSAAAITHPTEQRRFSIAELKRIQSLPDDFVLTGSFAQQWERIGRMVPPVMMMNIAKTVRDEILCKIKS